MPYIDKSRAIDALYGITTYKGTIPLESAVFNIDKMPTADVVEVKHGYWKHRDGDLWVCSECRGIQCCPRKFCGDCGARMDGKETEDE